MNRATVFVITTIDAPIFAISVTDNSFVIVTVAKNIKMKTIMKLFVVDMVASDLLTSWIPLWY